MSRKERARLLIEDIVKVARAVGFVPTQRVYIESKLGKFTVSEIRALFSSWTTALAAAGLTSVKELRPPLPEEKREAKILIFDIETAPILGYVWGMWEQNVALNQIKSDWHLLSWAAKWLDKPEMFYMDQRNAKNVEDDKKILEGLWELLNEADVVLGQNSRSFDTKKVNARFIINDIKPPSPYHQIDTKVLAKKYFAFTSNKLEYMADKLCTKKKSDHKEFQGFELWRECLKGNKRAWDELKSYNISDVLATEELYKKLAPWGAGLNLNLFHSDSVFRCSCGSTNLISRGFNFNATGKYRKYQCKDCGGWCSEAGAKNNLFSELKKASLKKPSEG